jgi:hypothetical protein
MSFSIFLKASLGISSADLTLFTLDCAFTCSSCDGNVGVRLLLLRLGDISREFTDNSCLLLLAEFCLDVLDEFFYVLDGYSSLSMT